MQVDSNGAVTQQGAPLGATVNNSSTESSKLSPWLMLIALLAGMALMGQFWAISTARDAKRAAEVNTMRVEGLTRAMIAHGIKDTYPHLPGEDP
jgi:hypothetical protein